MAKSGGRGWWRGHLVSRRPNKNILHSHIYLCAFPTRNQYLPLPHPLLLLIYIFITLLLLFSTTYIYIHLSSFFSSLTSSNIQTHTHSSFPSLIYTKHSHLSLSLSFSDLYSPSLSLSVPQASSRSENKITTATQYSEKSSMEMESCVPPGFRFRPTEEELVGYYLKKKINSMKMDLDVIGEIDLYKIEPWDIQDRCKMGYEEEKEWYFFSHKDKKYPTGTRTNRATATGFWKATGRDKAVMTKKNRIIGMRKTLVFYKGRAPYGSKTDWIMHEFRLQTSQLAPPQEEGWVVCRAFKKPSPTTQNRQSFECWSRQALFFRDQISNPTRPQSLSFPNETLNQMLYPTNEGPSFSHPFTSNQHHQQFLSDDTVLDGNNNSQLVELIPQLHSPTTARAVKQHGFTNEDCYNNIQEGTTTTNNNNVNDGQGIDWKSLDNLFTSQFTDDDTASAADAYFSHPNLPLMPHNSSHDLQVLQPQNHQASHVLGCLPHS